VIFAEKPVAVLIPSVHYQSQIRLNVT